MLFEKKLSKCLHPLGISRKFEITPYTNDLYLKETVYTFKKKQNNIVCIRRVLWLCAGSHSDALSLLFIDEQSDTIPLYLNNNVDMIKV